MDFSSYKNKVVFSLFFIAFFVFLFLLPNSVFALEINYPKVPGAVSPQEFLQSASTTPEQIPALYVKYIFNLILWASGFAVLGVLIWAGIRYLTSAGKPEVILAAREQITSAFLGILILLSSFIILKAVNPQLVILETPEPEPIEIVERPETPLLPTEKHMSSIDTEIPLAQVIEKKVFGKELMTKIKDNASTTSDIAQTLKDQIEDLNDTVDDCDCGEADPDCGSSCSSYCTKDCTCDVCDNERSDINDIEEKNLKKIDEMKEEQKKTIEEIRLLGEELSKLEMAENLLKACPLSLLDSLAGFLSKTTWFKDEDWSLKKILTWDKISVIDPQKKTYDWATFYCPVGGTFREGFFSPTPPESTSTELSTQGVSTEMLSLACKSEVPIGEIIDRTKRTAKLLIARLENLLNLQGKMIQAVDEMHVLVSKCSSQQPMCCALCIRIKGVCVIQRCIGRACYFSDIDDKADEIAEIQGKIEEVVNDEDEKNMGIIPIIDNVVAGILKDLDNVIRKEMSTCVSETVRETTGFLGSCTATLGGVEPNKLCCDEQIKDFQDCLENCYLEVGQEKYKTCLQNCLKDKPEPQKWCQHYINFYCCHPQESQ